MNIKIFPKYPRYSNILADFLNKHGFNLGPLKREGFFISTLNVGYGRIDTLEALIRLRDEPKSATAFEFYFEEYIEPPQAEA